MDSRDLLLIIEVKIILLISKFSLKFQTEKPQRKEIYKFKCQDSKQNFFHDTEFTIRFTDCFRNEKGIQSKCSSFFKTFKTSINKSFKKIQINNDKPKIYGDKDLNDLNLVRTKIREFISGDKCKLGITIANAALKVIEMKMAESVADSNSKKLERFATDVLELMVIFPN